MRRCHWLSERCAVPGHWIAVKLFDASHVPGRAGCSCTPCTIDRNLDDAWASRRRRGRPRGKCHTSAFWVAFPSSVNRNDTGAWFYPDTNTLQGVHVCRMDVSRYEPTLRTFSVVRWAGEP